MILESSHRTLLHRSSNKSSHVASLWTIILTTFWQHIVIQSSKTHCKCIFVPKTRYWNQLVMLHMLQTSTWRIMSSIDAMVLERSVVRSQDSGVVIFWKERERGWNSKPESKLTMLATSSSFSIHFKLKSKSLFLKPSQGLSEATHATDLAKDDRRPQVCNARARLRCITKTGGSCHRSIFFLASTLAFSRSTWPRLSPAIACDCRGKYYKDEPWMTERTLDCVQMMVNMTWLDV